MKRICILIPVYNEEQVLPSLEKRLREACDSLPYQFRFLMVNDGSTDQSLFLMKKMRRSDSRFCILNLSRNYGKETAMLAGMDYFNEDALIFLDADLQDPPELIPELIRQWEQGYDDVYARRMSRKNETVLKKGTSFLYYRILQKLSSVPIQKDTGDFRLLDKRCVNAIKSLRETGRCTKSLFSFIGYRKKEVLFERPPRAAGKTKWNYRKLWALAVDGITSLSTAPLGFSIGAGLLSLFASLLFFLWGFLPGFWEAYPYVPFLAAGILFLFGVQFLFLGIFGEYLGRIFMETKNRPSYFVDFYNERKEENVETNSSFEPGMSDRPLCYKRPS